MATLSEATPSRLHSSAGQGHTSFRVCPLHVACSSCRASVLRKAPPALDQGPSAHRAGPHSLCRHRVFGDVWGGGKGTRALIEQVWQLPARVWAGDFLPPWS